MTLQDLVKKAVLVYSLHNGDKTVFDRLDKMAEKDLPQAILNFEQVPETSSSEVGNSATRNLIQILAHVVRVQKKEETKEDAMAAVEKLKSGFASFKPRGPRVTIFALGTNMPDLTEKYNDFIASVIASLRSLEGKAKLLVGPAKAQANSAKYLAELKKTRMAITQIEKSAAQLQDQLASEMQKNAAIKKQLEEKQIELQQFTDKSHALELAAQTVMSVEDCEFVAECLNDENTLAKLCDEITAVSEEEKMKSSITAIKTQLASALTRAMTTQDEKSVFNADEQLKSMIAEGVKEFGKNAAISPMHLRNLNLFYFRPVVMLPLKDLNYKLGQFYLTANKILEKLQQGNLPKKLTANQFSIFQALTQRYQREAMVQTSPTILPFSAFSPMRRII